MESSLTAGLIVLTSGYLFSRIFFPSKVAIAREDGHRLYFRAAFYAVFSFIWTVLTLIIIKIDFGFTNQCNEALANTNSYLGFITLLSGCVLSSSKATYITTTSTLIVSPILAKCANLLFYLPLYLRLEGKWEWASGKKAMTYSIAKNDELEKLIYQSMYRTGLPLMLTLEGGKVYVGWTGLDPDWSGTKEDNNYLKILPIVSGYRDSRTQTFKPTTFYQDMYKLCDFEAFPSRQPSDFEIVIPSKKLISIHQFDLSIYAKYMGDEDEDEDEDE